MTGAETPTHCPYCALQCGMTLRPVPGPEVAEVVERTGFPVNRGALCGKGRTAPAVLRQGVRLTSPLVRRRPGGELEEAGWDEALGRIAEGLGGCGRRTGRTRWACSAGAG